MVEEIRKLKQYEIDILDYYERKHIQMQWKNNNTPEMLLEEIKRNRDCFITVSSCTYVLIRDPKKQMILKIDKETLLLPIKQWQSKTLSRIS